jgi:uncharacterized protein (DUF2141 family)
VAQLFKNTRAGDVTDLEMRTLFFLLAAMLAVPEWASAEPLRVQVEGLRPAIGQIRCALHDKPEGFPRHPERARQIVFVPVSGPSASCELAMPTSDAFAISVIHDRNSNGKLDMALGIPTEGLAFSRNPRPVMRAPTFEEAAIGAANVRDGAIAVTMRYR